MIAAGHVRCSLCGRAVFPSEASWLDSRLILASHPVVCKHPPATIIIAAGQPPLADGPGNRTNASRTPMHGTHDQGPPRSAMAQGRLRSLARVRLPELAVKTAAARIRGPLVFAWQRAIRDADTNAPSRSAKLVAFVMATFANPDGRSCRPGVEWIRQATVPSRRTIERAEGCPDQGWLHRLRDSRIIARLQPVVRAEPPNGASLAGKWPPSGVFQSLMSRRPEQIDPPPAAEMNCHPWHTTSSETCPRPHQRRAEAAEVIRSNMRDATDDEIEKLLAKLDQPYIRNLAAYITTLAQQGDLVSHLAELCDDRRRRQLADDLAEMRQGPECAHGFRGGAVHGPILASRIARCAPRSIGAAFTGA